MKGKRKQKKTSSWKRLAGIHVRVSVWMFVTYLVLSIAYSPEFLLSDIRHKYRALADDTVTITAKVLNPPVKPVVSAESSCVDGRLPVTLDWPDNENSVSYDISRDGLTLAAGLSVSSYVDSAVVPGITYSYEVTARGPMGPGEAVSDPVTVTTPDICEIVFVPAVEMLSFGGKSVGSFSGVPKISVRKPVFSGTTNIPSATIDVFVAGSSLSISARTTANANGYFEWRPPVRLPYGPQTIFVTASHPFDPSVRITNSFLFIITDDRDSDVSSYDNAVAALPMSIRASSAKGRVHPPSPLSFELGTASPEAYQGGDVGYSLKITSLDPSYEGWEATATYSVIYRDGSIVLTTTEPVTLRSGMVSTGTLMLPSYIRDGAYRLRADLRFGSFDIAREASFSVLPLPILDFGGGYQVTYAQILSHMGSISILLLLLLLLWVSMFVQEYLMFLESVRRITERNLMKAGFFGPGGRKGVTR